MLTALLNELRDIDGRARKAQSNIRAVCTEIGANQRIAHFVYPIAGTDVALDRITHLFPRPVVRVLHRMEIAYSKLVNLGVPAVRHCVIPVLNYYLIGAKVQEVRAELLADGLGYGAWTHDTGRITRVLQSTETVDY